MDEEYYAIRRVQLSHGYNFDVNDKLYFWHKTEQKIGYVIVKQISTAGFIFEYMGKHYKFLYSQAKGRLYCHMSDLPQYSEELRRRERAEKNYNYRPDLDTRVLFGD